MNKKDKIKVCLDLENTEQTSVKQFYQRKPENTIHQKLIQEQIAVRPSEPYLASELYNERLNTSQARNTKSNLSKTVIKEVTKKVYDEVLGKVNKVDDF